MGRPWAACLLISSYGIQAAALAAARKPPSESLWQSALGVDGIDLVNSTYVVPAAKSNRLFVVGNRKPVMWVHLHKSAGTFMCVSAHRANESVVAPDDSSCNSRDLHDTFFPDGLHTIAQPLTCKDRTAYFRAHNFTWGQVEHEIGSNDLCKSDFIYGITLRETVARMSSYVNWNNKRVLGWRYREMLACIEQRNESMCPRNPGWSTQAATNFGYREYDNFAVRSLGGYHVMGVPLGGVNRTHYDLAVKALRKLDIVLILEEMFTNYSQALMDSTLGWHVEAKNPPERANWHSISFTGEDVRRIQQINQYDVQLYAQALKAIHRNAASMPRNAEGPQVSQAHLPRPPQKQKVEKHEDASQAHIPQPPQKQKVEKHEDASQAHIPQPPQKQKVEKHEDAKFHRAQIPWVPKEKVVSKH